MQSIVRHRNKSIDKIRKWDKNSKQFTRENLTFCDTEIMKRRKVKIGKKKIGKRKEGKRDSCSSINGPKSRIHHYPIISIQTQTKSRSLKKVDKALPNSPHKRNDIVKNQLQEPTLKGRKPKYLKEKEGQWIVSIYLLLCGTLQKKYESLHKTLAASHFPWKGFFTFFLSFFFIQKKWLGASQKPSSFRMLHKQMFSFFFMPKK